MKKLKESFRFIFSYWDYYLVVTAIFLKIYYFSNVSDTLFSTMGLSEIPGFIHSWIATGDAGKLFDGVLLISIGTIFLATFWVLFFYGKTRLLVIAFLNLVLSFIILADTVYFRYFEDIISMTVLMQMKQIGDVGGSIAALLNWSDLFFAADILVLLIIWKWSSVKEISFYRPKVWVRLLTALSVFCLGWILTVSPFEKSMENGGEWQFNKLISNMRVYNFTGLLGFHATNFTRYVNENYINKKVYTEEEINQAEKNVSTIQNARNVFPFEGQLEGKNIIVLQIEALQDFILFQEMNGEEITPNLNKLAKESLYFTEFYEQTALGRTSDAEFLLNTSLYPTGSGSAYMLHAENKYNALPNILKQEGYETSVYHPYKPSFWNRYIMYNQLGIDTFYSEEDFRESEVIGWAINDDALLQQSIDYMTESSQPFYSHIITLTSHHPFEMPEHHKKLDTTGYGGYHNRHFVNYVHSLHYVDWAIGNFINRLKQEGLYEESILVMFGDHGAGFSSEREAYKEFASIHSEVDFFEESKNVPLLIHHPSLVASTYSHVTSQLDLAPSILSMIGASQEETYFLGNSLWDKDSSKAVFRNASFITNDWTFMASSDGIFENGTCFNRKDGKTVEINFCKGLYDQGVSKLQLSDDILNGNMIKSFIQN
ncbi:LTA synthase family protein [Chryseomicrobium palamuruense]